MAESVEDRGSGSGSDGPVVGTAEVMPLDARSLPSTTASEKTLLVLEAALLHDRFTEVVDATGLSKGTTHRILATLVERQFISLAADGNYLPGPRTLSLSGHALARIDVSAIATPIVEELVRRVQCTVHLGMVNGDEIIYLVRSDSDKPYRMPSRIGHSIPMHSSGIGKVVLGTYTDEELARFVSRAGLVERTGNTITTLEALRAETARVRKLGYALDDEENVSGISCVAAPIRDHTGIVKYGLSISTLTLEHTIRQVEDMAPDVLEAAAKISAALGYQPVGNQDQKTTRSKE